MAIFTNLSYIIAIMIIDMLILGRFGEDLISVMALSVLLIGFNIGLGLVLGVFHGKNKL